MPHSTANNTATRGSGAGAGVAPSQSPQDSRQSSASTTTSSRPPPPATPAPAHRATGNRFSIPAPLRQLFDRFPLFTYPPNELPVSERETRRRRKGKGGEHALYVFTTDEDAATGTPSFNPGCLKWQTYLHMSHIPFTTIPSTNHASPTGSLPFLLPCSPSASKSTTAPKEDAPPFPIPTTKLQKWARDQPAPASVPDEPETERYEPYLALLDHNIRNAWGSVPTTDRVLRRPIQLHTLYLSPLNAHLPASLYITPSTTFPPLRTHLSQSLATAAESALHTHLGPIVDIEALYRDAELALDALETLLQTRGGKGNDTENTGQAPWFFSSPHPTYFDAAVFAYTHLLLDEGMGWRDTRLVSAVRKKTGLVKHRERVLRLCYPDLTYKGLQDRLEGPSM